MYLLCNDTYDFSILKENYLNSKNLLKETLNLLFAIILLDDRQVKEVFIRV